MKNLTGIVFIVLLLLSHCQDTPVDDHVFLQLDTPHRNLKQGKFQFKIPESKVPADGKWFFILEVQPDEKKDWVSSFIQISVGREGKQFKVARRCQADNGGVDSCYITNKNIDVKKDKIHAKVYCRGECTFTLSAAISLPFKMNTNDIIRMDFEDTAYTKVFTLDTTGFNSQFDQLRITLKPQTFLASPYPIGFYVNRGSTIPSKEQHDYTSLTLWDEGQGVFIDFPQAKGKFTIVIEGPDKNILLLQNQLIKFDGENQLQKNLPYFDYLGSQGKKYYKIKVDPGKNNNFKITTFSGAVKLLGIFDANRTQIKKQFKRMDRSYGQMEYQLSPQFFEDNKRQYSIKEYIYIRLEGIKESTFVLQSYYSNDGIQHLLPQLVKYVELPGRSYSQYYVMAAQAEPISKLATIKMDFVVENTRKDTPLKVRFFICKKEHGDDCELTKTDILSGKSTFASNTIVEYNKFNQTHQVGGTSIFEIVLKNTDFTQRQREKQKQKSIIYQCIMVIVVQNQQEQESLYKLQHFYQGKAITLKESQPRHDRISIEQSRFYTISSPSSDVKQIRIHLVEISGKVYMQGYFTDPLTSQTDGEQVTQLHNSLSFTVTKGQQIWIRVEGKSRAYYSISAQMIKESQMKNRPGRGHNEIILVQNIPYSFNLKPKEKVAYQLHSTSHLYELTTNAQLPLAICMTENLGLPPFPPNCQISQTVAKKTTKRIILDAPQNRIGNMGVYNDNDKIVTFEIQFVSVDAGCVNGKLGKQLKQSILSGKKRCLTYILNKLDEIQVIVELVNFAYKDSLITLLLGNGEKKILSSTLHRFTKEQVIKSCKSSQINSCELKVLIQSQSQTQARVLVQYLGEDVLLMDGVATMFSGRQARRFIYRMANNIKTTITVQNRKGIYKFYGQIVQHNSYHKGVSQFPTAKDNLFTSSNAFYFAFQTYVLDTETISKAKCREDCLLLLTVQADPNHQVEQQQGRFTIQVTQQDRVLVQNGQAIVGYLEKKSLGFYQFQYKGETQTQLMINVNTQQSKCINIYAKKADKKSTPDRATPSNYDYKSTTSTLLLKTPKEPTTYSITLQAVQNCPFSVQIISGANKDSLTHLRRDVIDDFKLQPKGSVNYVIQSSQQQQIKVLVLKQKGQVTVSARRYKSMKDLISSDSVSSKCDSAGKDFLLIPAKKSNCTSEVILLTLTSQVTSSGSITIPSPKKSSQIAIRMDTVVKDELEEDKSQIFRIYAGKIVQFQINVLVGKVSVQVKQSHDNKTTFNKNFTKTDEPLYQSFTTDSKSDYSYLSYYQVIITSLAKQSVYTYALISDPQVQKRGSNVQYGIPQYVNLQRDQSSCLKGIMDSGQKFLISSSQENANKYFQDTKIQLRVKQRPAKVKIYTGVKEMIVSVEDNVQPQSVYQFCLKSPKAFFLTFIQSSSVNYFPQNMPMLVNGSLNLTYHTSGTSVMEINECLSRAVTSVSTSFNGLGAMNSQIKQVRKSNNIVEFIHYGVVYVSVKAEKAIVEWFSKDQNDGIGLGYDQWAVDQIRISRTKDQMDVKINPLKSIGSKSKSKTKSITYKVYAAQEEKNLNNAMNCNQGTYLQRNGSTLSDNFGQTTNVKIPIRQIAQTFKGKKYILVAVKATLSVINRKGDLQLYRFSYPYQQVQMGYLLAPIDQPYIIPQEQESPSILRYVGIFIIIAIITFIVWKFIIKNIMRRCKKRGAMAEMSTGNSVHYQQFAQLK